MAGSWGWKRAHSIADTLAFLRGDGAYRRGVKEARIYSIGDTRPEYVIFYQAQPTGTPSPGWGHKLATDADDVVHYLNGTGGYRGPKSDAQICARQQGSTTLFDVFARQVAGVPTGGWAWKMSTDPSDVTAYLDGSGAYSSRRADARMAAVSLGRVNKYYVFARDPVPGPPIGNWNWKMATTIDDAHAYVTGTGAYSLPLAGFEVCAVSSAAGLRIYVFPNRGPSLWTIDPMPAARFVAGESASLKAQLTGHYAQDGSALSWSSSIDGTLGAGPSTATSSLSVGTHQITVAGYGLSATSTVRVFAHLDDLYASEPAPGELQRIDNDFTFDLVDDGAEQWSSYDQATFDQTSTDPSPLVSKARLDVLRRQRFSTPLPTASGTTIYEHIRQHLNTIKLRLDCTLSVGGGSMGSFNRGFSVWDSRASATPESPDQCKVPFASPSLAHYIQALQLFVHEARHTEPDDPSHTSCNGKTGMDQSFEGGSGYAAGAMYAMWVYKYGLYDSPEAKEEARTLAVSILQGRFCTPVTHSNPTVQALLDELL